MKNQIVACLAALLFFSLSLSAQHKVYSHFKIMMDTINVDRYVPEHSAVGGSHTVVLATGYGDFILDYEKKIDVLYGASILHVDLVYTQYPVDEDYSALNKKRLQYLHMVAPEVFSNPGTTWSLVAQNAPNHTAASHLFHGFVIKYAAAPTAESSALEREYLDAVACGKATLRDSTVLKIMERNNFKSGAVVADFTGSMSPYVVQLLAWYELHFMDNDFEAFAFFNDGNTIPDASKKIGETKGIYHSKSTSREDVLTTAQTCIANGYGGDCPENDIEAILDIIKKNPELKEVILIADNNSPMRDYTLMDKINIPVRVVLCGTFYGINPQYMDLAHHTKGSVHTIEEDILELAKIHEGKTIDINHQTFRLERGKFVLVTKT